MDLKQTCHRVPPISVHFVRNGLPSGELFDWLSWCSEHKKKLRTVAAGLATPKRLASVSMYTSVAGKKCLCGSLHA